MLDCQKNNGKELDVIPSRAVFFVAAKPLKLLSRKKSAGTQFDVTSRGRTSNVDKSAGWIGVPGPAAGRTMDGEKPSVPIRIPTGPVTPSAVERERELHKTSGHALYRRWCRWCAAARTADEPHLRKQEPETDEAVSRIEFDSAELEREEDQTLSTSFSTRR